jgi:hypothetical protein
MRNMLSMRIIVILSISLRPIRPVDVMGTSCG